MSIPIWLLGSSDFSARLAGQLGLPFEFASHFAPEYTLPALDVYRRSFQASDVLDEPYAIVIAADETEQASLLATSLQQQFLSLVRGKPSKLQPPVENMDHLWNEHEKTAIQRQIGSSIIGNRKTVREQLQSFLHQTEAFNFNID